MSLRKIEDQGLQSKLSNHYYLKLLIQQVNCYMILSTKQAFKILMILSITKGSLIMHIEGNMTMRSLFNVRYAIAINQETISDFPDAKYSTFRMRQFLIQSKMMYLIICSRSPELINDENSVANRWTTFLQKDL